MRLEAGADQDETVGLEELPEVALGQQARVTGVAGTLEAVDRDGLERVCGRDLVDHEHPPAETGDPHELGKDELGALDVVKGPERACEIERPVCKRKRGRVPLHEGGVRGRTGARERDELGDAVDADHLSHERSERERECARSAADVERALVAARTQERADTLGELVRTVVLVRGKARGHAGEAVLSHRRRHVAPATRPSRFGRRART